jgi:hypothetical protein
MTIVDPGSPLVTPSGTGRYGTPIGDGMTWGDPGSIPADGTQGSVTMDAPMITSQDGTGSR